MKLKWSDPIELTEIDETFNLQGRKGVYVIWFRSSTDIQVVYVGKGDIADRFACHVNREEIRKLLEQPGADGTVGNAMVMFTWAFVSPEANRVGIERFLAGVFRPSLGQKFPLVQPIPVNLPPVA